MQTADPAEESTDEDTHDDDPQHDDREANVTNAVDDDERDLDDLDDTVDDLDDTVDDFDDTVDDFDDAVEDFDADDDFGDVAVATEDDDAALDGWIAELSGTGASLASDALIEIEDLVDVFVVDPGTTSLQNAGLESLWFQLDDDFTTTALVPVPPMTSKHARKVALDLAKIGAAISHESIFVVSALDVNAVGSVKVAEAIRRPGDTRTIVVADAPSKSTASIPIVRSASRTVLLVELRRSLVDATERTIDIIGADRISGIVCVEPPNTRRFRRRSR